MDIAVHRRYNRCIRLHTNALIERGVIKEEFEETLEIKVYIGGGPSLIYAADTILTLNQFSEAKD